MSENMDPAPAPPPGADWTWGRGTPPPPAAGSWGAATPPSVPRGTFAPGGVGGAGSAPGGSWGAPPPSNWSMQPPPRPPRSARVHVIWLIVAVVAALGCGTAGFVVGKSSAQISADIKSGAAAAKTSSCRGASVAPSAGHQLASALVPLPPHTKYLKGGYRHQVDTLDQYIATLYSKSSHEKARMVARCFQVAAQQGWTWPSGRIVAVYLAQFGTHADARSYALAAQSADLADPLNRLHNPVSGVADGILIEAPKPDKYGNTVTRLIGDKGNVAIIVHIFMPAHLPRWAFAMGILRHQAARL
ncbi:MAG: hypothetical protein ACTHKL_17390 [Streptosporangiaceae bacterium]